MRGTAGCENRRFGAVRVFASDLPGKIADNAFSQRRRRCITTSAYDRYRTIFQESAGRAEKAARDSVFKEENCPKNDRHITRWAHAAHARFKQSIARDRAFIPGKRAALPENSTAAAVLDREVASLGAAC